MHPTFTHVPPNPHVVPKGEGFTKSAKPTFFPRETACFADAIPPEPPPITKRSKSKCYSDISL